MVKNKKNKKEIKIITDKSKNSEYTFVDVSLVKSMANPPLNQGEDDNLSGPSNKNNKQDNDDEKSIKRYPDRFKKTDFLRFKANKATRGQSKQNHSPVYE